LPASNFVHHTVLRLRPVPGTVKLEYQIVILTDSR
jgi:hypothetical protein